VVLCRRTLTRRIVWRIMRAWHHQAVYGRVDGLYSRPQLIMALADEKQNSLALGDKAQQLQQTLQARNPSNFPLCIAREVSVAMRAHVVAAPEHCFNSLVS
jgi:hypothetical protein